MTDDLTGDLDGHEAEPKRDFADADAFFAAEVNTVRPAVLRLYNKTYTLPARMPLSFSLLLERHHDDTGLETFRAILGPIFGQDALDFWLSKGIDDRRLGIVLGWAIANMNEPGSVSLAEAARIHDDRVAGKAQEPTTMTPNRADRRQKQRAAGGTRYSRTGR